MEIFLKLLPDKTTTFCANWITGSVISVDDGDSVRGLMSDMFRRPPEESKPVQPKTVLSYSELPDGFLTH
ncbi:MAG: hypothetical protein LBK67_08335, partial [Coriobacteriales bacterium]|nr:hypothetical protein [Coriobacteriales bacterium]